MSHTLGSIKTSDGVITRVPIKAVPSGDSDGLYKLVVDATVTVGDVDVAQAKRDGDLLAKYADEDPAVMTLDVNGHLWIAGYNLADAIMHSDDLITDLAYDGDNNIGQIDYHSEKWRTIFADSTLKVTEIYTWTLGNLTKITREIVSGA